MARCREPEKKEVETLAQKFSLHQLNVEDSLSKRKLSKMDDHNENIFVLFHFPVSAKSNLGITTSQISFFLGNNFLISIHEPNLDTVTKLFQNYQQSAAQLDSLKKSSARLIYQILDPLVDNLFPFLQKVEENLEDISDRVFDEKQSICAA
jgi:magnesium transporter